MAAKTVDPPIKGRVPDDEPEKPFRPRQDEEPETPIRSRLERDAPR